jgi:hypothetical protein
MRRVRRRRSRYPWREIGLIGGACAILAGIVLGPAFLGLQASIEVQIGAIALLLLIVVSLSYARS